jgi:cytidylate kinase
MNVTITGNLGAGKTSVCNELKKMGYDVISGGDIYRTYAQEHGITIVELNEMAKTDRSVDIQIDERTKKLGTEVDHTIFDSRMAWHFVPDALNIFLAVDAKTAAERVYADKLRKGEERYSNSDCEYTEKELQKRAELERERFIDMYGVDYFDQSHYDVIINTEKLTPREVAKEIDQSVKRIEHAKIWVQNDLEDMEEER